MKTKLLVIISLLFVGGGCFGQVMFQKVMTSNYGCAANAIEQTTDGGYIITGAIQDSGYINSKVYLIKTNKDGDILWTKTFGGYENVGLSDFESGGSFVEQTLDSGYIVVGSTNGDSYLNSNLYIIKTNANGDLLWAKTYGGTNVASASFVQQCNDDGYIITGNTTSFGAGGYDVYLLKINSSGDITWAKTYGRSGDDFGECVRQTSDNGYIICGYTFNSPDSSGDVYLIKTNPNGDTLWTRIYGSTGDDEGYSIVQTIDGGYAIAGFTTSFGAGDENIFLLKTDDIGDTLWTKTYSRGYSDYASSIQQTTDSGYIIIGFTDSIGFDHRDFILIKVNSSGDVNWANTYREENDNSNFAYGGQETIDDGYIIAGVSEYGSSGANAYLIKTDSNGNSGCNQSAVNLFVGSTSTVVRSINTIVGSGGIASSTPTIVGSGGTDSTLCLTVGINELSNNSIISLYPNPTNDQLTITGNWKANQNYILTITNLLGETIYTQAADSNQQTVNCKPFLSGIYFVRVANDKESWVGKFVKE